jgi:spore coat polysaccharide biosynthesis protein SpsF
LPGKVLRDLAGRPMLQFQLERLRRGIAPEWVVVVATSSDSIDDPIAELAGTLGVEVVRGSESDVLGRFALALDTFPSRTVVRLTGDCPLTDPAIVADVVTLHEASGAAYSSNVYPRSFPRGLDVEVMTDDALRTAAAEARDPVEREHVTPFLVRRPHRFPMATLFTDDDLGDEHWTVDRPEDLERVRSMVAAVEDPVRAGWRDVLAAVGRTPLAPGAIHLRPVAPPSPGSAPWVRTWIAERDGREIGRAEVAVDEETVIRVTADGQEGPDVEAALAQLLAGDVQISRSTPT